MASYAKGLSMAVDHPTGNPSLNCLQLVDILHRVRIPDWACELQRWPNQEPTFRFLLKNPSLAGLVGDIGNVPNPSEGPSEGCLRVRLPGTWSL